MTLYQLCCLWIFTVLASAMMFDPVTSFVLANPRFVLRRLIFAGWYMFWTHPRLMPPLMQLFPRWAAWFYGNLLADYLIIFMDDLEDKDILEIFKDKEDDEDE